MANYPYNTRISLIKAGRIVNSRIIISLVFIWSALIIATAFLFINNTDSFLQKENNKKLQFFTAGETDKQNNDGAFVFVVRNKQMILTKYKGFIDKNRQHTDEAKPAVAITAPQRTTTIVLQQKHTRQERQPDFSVKKVPVQ